MLSIVNIAIPFSRLQSYMLRCRNNYSTVTGNSLNNRVNISCSGRSINKKSRFPKSRSIWFKALLAIGPLPHYCLIRSREISNRKHFHTVIFDRFHHILPSTSTRLVFCFGVKHGRNRRSVNICIKNTYRESHFCKVTAKFAVTVDFPYTTFTRSNGDDILNSLGFLSFDLVLLNL